MSMWEPRSSHLYVCTGLRVCEWLRVGAGTPCLCPCRGQSGIGRARVSVCHGVCVGVPCTWFVDLPLRTSHHVPISVCVSGM